MKYLLNKKIRMRDGVELSSDIYMPDTEPPYPVLLVRTPYDSRSETRINYAKYYVEKGYCVITQDVRGRGDSDGIFVPYVNESNDGYDTIKWIVEQPWCLNKAVAMIAGSYHGSVQWEVAKTAIPELKVISPAVIGSNLFKDTFYSNGILNSVGVHWPRSISGRTNQAVGIQFDNDAIMKTLPLKDMDKSAGCDIPAFQEWLSHPTYDNYWRKLSVEEYYDKIKVPVFIIGGWYDLFAAGCIRNYMGIKKYGNKKIKQASRLIMGPWNHSTFDIPSSVLGCVDFGKGRFFDTKEVQEKWLAKYFKDDDNAEGWETPVYIFIMGENIWREENEWPLRRTEYRDMYLSSGGRANSMFGDGKLSWKKQSESEKDMFVYNPADPTPALNPELLNGMPEDQRPVERRDDVLVYTSDKLSSPLEVSGFINLDLYVSSTAVDTDFFAKFCDVYPDGRSINLCEGIVRARFREGLDKEIFMLPNKVYCIRLEVGVTANLFKTGHRIRLEISSASFPAYTRNLNTGEPVGTGKKMKKACQSVYHSAEYPSKLILPIIPR